MVPNCPHYISSALVVGKIAICWRCDEKFVVTTDMVRTGKEMLKLHCKKCTKGSKSEKKIIPSDDAIASLLSNLLDDGEVGPRDEDGIPET